MALETATYINGLNTANPAGPDRLMQGDDHIRLIKAVLKATFPNLTGAMTQTQDTLNGLSAKTVPVGAICLWFGSAASVPAGWALCDGSTVARSDGSGTITTPNMADRVPVGVGDYALGATFGAATVAATTTGLAGSHGHSGTASAAGEHTHGGVTGSTALGIDQIPSHSHTVACGIAEGDNPTNFTNGGSNIGSPVTTSSAGSGAGHTHTISHDGSHTHGVSIGSAGEHNHTIPAINVAQPSIALYYIMKV